MKKRNFLAVLASLALMTSMFGISASALGTNYTAGLTNATSDGTTPVSKNTTAFDKYLVMDINANVPNSTFNFAITKYNADKDEKAVIVDADDTNLAVINGIVNGAKFTGGALNEDVVFAPTDAVTNEDGNTNTAVVFKTTENKTDEKFAAKTLTLDFSGVKFDEPGVYRYLITETGTNQAVANDTGVTGENNTFRTLDVYVEDYNAYYDSLADNTDYTAPTEKELFIAGYVLYNGKNDNAPAKAGGDVTKSTSYTNTYTTHDLTFTKTVTGNQGSKDKYFKFDVTIGNAVANTVYDVDLSNADATVPNNSATIYENVTNPATITFDGTGTQKTSFYLQNGQSITIRGLAEGTSYKVEETPEDYIASAEVTGDDKTNSNADAIAIKDNAVEDTELTDDTTIVFTNNRQGTIPTGVILSVAAPVVIGLAVLGGIIFLVIRNKKRNDEDDE